MPTNLPVLPNISRKSLRLTALLLLSPLFFFGQTLTGLWTGALSNDSTTVRKDQSFEIALTEYRGKVYGYSRSEFIVDDTLYYVVKRVKGTIDGDVCEVTDDEIMSYNFRGKLDKGIKVTSTFRKNQTDSTWYLDGTWKTNATKKYYAVTGKVGLEEEKDLTASKIFPHLEELGLTKDIAFYQERKEVPAIVRTVRPEKIITEYSTKTLPQINNTDVAIAVSKPALQRAETKPVPAVASSSIIEKPDEIEPGVTPLSSALIGDIPVTETNEKNTLVKIPVHGLPNSNSNDVSVGSVAVTPSASNKTIAVSKIPEATTKPTNTSVAVAIPQTSIELKKQGAAPVIAKNNLTTSAASSVADSKPLKTEPVAKATSKPEKIEIKQPGTVSSKTQNEIAKTIPVKAIPDNKKLETVSSNSKMGSVAVNNPVPEKKETKTEPMAVVSVVPEEKKPAVDIIAKASLVAGRKSDFSQIVSFKSDSLELSLYDNGEIDGDTVSVFMNGEVIMSKQGLKASAIKKTIYITPGNEDFTLVLFAENLGKYPPNTGLLVVHDGEEVYNLRFSSDFQKSSGIVFRKKR